jgi:DNA invertase Pin-like site-specific DNA recombinase
LVRTAVDNDTSAFQKRRIRVQDGEGGYRWAWRVIRPDWEKSLAAVRAGEADTLLVVHLDRLTRDPRDLEDAIELVEHYGATVLDLSGSLDLSTDHGIFLARMMVAHANLSSRDTSRRKKRYHRAYALEGRPHWGPRPYGWQPGGVVLVEEEAERLRGACERLLAGVSPYSIAAEWNAAGVLTANGKRWTSGTFQGVLTNPRIAGYSARWATQWDSVRQIERRWREIVRREDGSEVEGQWTPVVSRATWEAVCHRFGLIPGGPPMNMAAEPGSLVEGEGVRDDPRRGRPGSRGGRNTRRYLLSGLARCGSCGAGLCGGPYTGYPDKHMYRCPGTASGGCGGVSRSGQPLDAYVVEAALAKYEAELAAHAVTGDRVERGSGEWPKADRLASIERKLAEAYARWKADKMSGADYFAMREDLEGDRSRLRREEATWLGERAKLDGPTPASTDPRTAWDMPAEEGGLTLVAKREFLFAQLLAVEVLPCPVDPVTGKRRRRWDPDCVRLIWRGRQPEHGTRRTTGTAEHTAA